jgi:hypothetical protein
MSVLVSEVVTWAAKAAELREYCRIYDTTQDSILRQHLSCVTEMADQFFSKQDFLSAAEIKTPIIIGCYAYCKVMMDTQDRTMGLTSKTVGPYSESYASVVGESSTTDARRIAYEYWEPYYAPTYSTTYRMAFRA